MEKVSKSTTSSKTDSVRTGLPVIAVAVTALVAIALLLPCILANLSDTIYPRTSVAGIALGGMSRSEAIDVLERELPSVYAEAELPVTVLYDMPGNSEDTEKTFHISLSDIGIDIDNAKIVDAAYENGREDNFFVNGISYVKGLLFGYSVAPMLTADPQDIEAQIAEIAAKADIPVTECSWRIQGDSLIVTKPKNGYLLDRAALLTQASDAISRYDLAPIECTPTESAPPFVTMEEIYQDGKKQVSNAYYDKKEKVVKEGHTGIEFDPVSAQALMDQATPGTEFSVPVTIIRPKISREEMTANLFRDTLGSCTTSVSGSANRKHNVSLASNSCNGVVLNPGEEFSYNATLGKRTAAKGYLPAGAYVGGKTVSEYGGGICQISSTLYLAVLRSNLEITSRTNHMFYPGYIPYGMDATVSWGGPDFKFRNNTDYPIRILATYKNGKATCTIQGTNLTGNTVKMEYKVLSSTAYNTVEKPDSTLKPGERKQEQNGYTGYKVATYRCIYDKNGSLVSRTPEANSTYKSRDRIILVGPDAPTPPVTPSPPTPENPTVPDIVPEKPNPDLPLTPDLPEAEIPETPIDEIPS